MTPDELQALLNQRNQSVVICHCGSGGFNVAGAQVLSIVPSATAQLTAQPACTAARRSACRRDS